MSNDTGLQASNVFLPCVSPFKLDLVWYFINVSTWTGCTQAVEGDTHGLPCTKITFSVPLFLMLLTLVIIWLWREESYVVVLWRMQCNLLFLVLFTDKKLLLLLCCMCPSLWWYHHYKKGSSMVFSCNTCFFLNLYTSWWALGSTYTCHWFW